MKYAVILDECGVPSQLYEFDNLDNLGEIFWSEMGDHPDQKKASEILERFDSEDMNSIDEIEVMLHDNLEKYFVILYNFKDIAESFILAGVEWPYIDKEAERREWLDEMKFESERGN